jgi:(p)ppGpp synthase/HD superfamily hydrolase
MLIVAGTVIEHGPDEDIAIAALLHDAVEDQGGAKIREQIKARFGHQVADLVDEVSDAEVTPKPPWRERKESYLANIRTMSPVALLIAKADKVHNTRCTLANFRRMGEKVWTRFNAGKTEQAWFYERFLEEAASHPSAPSELVAELRRIDAELFSSPDPRPLA